MNEEITHEIPIIDDEQVDIDMENNGEDRSNKESNQINNERSNAKNAPMWLLKFYNTNSLLIRAICGILIAYAYPPLGAQYLHPQVTATWLAVLIIFVLSGLSLKSEELAKSFLRVKFNLFVQCFNFLATSAIVFGIAQFLVSVGVISKALGDGMIICSCLPMTINMVIVLTKSSGGDEAAAIFNAAFGNMIGVFLTPLLIFGYLGVSGEISLLNVFYKLALRVLLPILIGQLLRKFSSTVVAFAQKHKSNFKNIQEWCIVYIVYTVFCKSFQSGLETSVGGIFIMIACQFVILSLLMVLVWFLLKVFFRNQPKLRVMGLLGSTHKTMAMGIPLITAIYDNNPNVGLFTLPLMVWHPMQLLIGSIIAPRLFKFVQNEEKRLNEMTTLSNADTEIACAVSND